MRHATTQMHASGFSSLLQRHCADSALRESCSELSPFAGYDLALLGAGAASRARRVASSMFLDTSPARGPASGSASGKKIEWDTLPFEVPAPSDGKVVIDREDEENLPDEEPSDIGPVVPPHPPKPSAMGDLRGEANGPRPAVHSQLDADEAEPADTVTEAPEEVSGYVRETRTVETGKWPPHPRQDGNADLPAGPVPSIKIYAEHRYADAEKANESWSELLRQHEEAEASGTARQTELEVHLRDLKDEAESQQDAPEPLYKSPNADNVIPPELRTGLER
ncbi:unnamed protein product [Symbiodinium natans]|uniref:Uncharacterized protein n=1 Tax=Symbiodinium natans TaxID=878477 RepID=A0A812QVP0_9DINO|nr:unnamed protein product [Symbiodinium natans]